MCGLSKWHTGPFPHACYFSDQQGVCSPSPSVEQRGVCSPSPSVVRWGICSLSPSMVHCIAMCFLVCPAHANLAVLRALCHVSLASHTEASQPRGAADSSPDTAAEQERKVLLTLAGRQEAPVLVSRAVWCPWHLSSLTGLTRATLDSPDACEETRLSLTAAPVLC